MEPIHYLENWQLKRWNEAIYLPWLYERYFRIANFSMIKYERNRNLHIDLQRLLNYTYKKETTRYILYILMKVNNNIHEVVLLKTSNFDHL